jgi:hypothetical protein
MNPDDPSVTEVSMIDILTRTEEPVILQRDGPFIRLTLPGRSSWDGHRTFRASTLGGVEYALQLVLERAAASLRARATD